MVPAPDQTHNRPRRWLFLGLVVAACVGQAGCARLGPFRKPASPAFGTESAAGADHPSGDLYADLVSKPKPFGGTPSGRRDELATIGQEYDAEAKAEAAASEPASRAEPPETANDAGPAIALQPPVTLPAFTEPRDSLTVVSNRSAAAFGWKAESKPRGEPTPVALEAAAAPTPAATGPTLETLLAECRQKLDALTTYQVRMHHQERVGILLNPAEDVVLSIRRKPQAVRIEWREGPHKGREVLYAADANKGQLHVRMGEGLLAAPRISIAPDSPMALRSGRHPIQEAGFDHVVARMEEGLSLQKTGDPAGGKLAYAGLETPGGLDKPCHKITRAMPSGEQWVVFLDPESSLPAFIEETAANGDLLARYIFRGLTPNVAELAKAEAFDPDARWGPPTGLLQRLARSAGGNAAAAKTQ